MTNAYYKSVAVGSAQEASIFANEFTWTILEVLRRAGAKGLTAREVLEKVERKMGTSVSSSKVYSLLKRLYEIEFIHRYYDADEQAQRNVIGEMWGGYFPNEEFDKAVTSKTSSYVKKNLFPILFQFVKVAMDELGKDPATKKWLPQTGTSNLCRRCHSSHEADEFFDSLLDIAASEFVESKEFQKYQQQAGFGREEED